MIALSLNVVLFCVPKCDNFVSLRGLRLFLGSMSQAVATTTWCISYEHQCLLRSRLPRNIPGTTATLMEENYFVGCLGGANYSDDYSLVTVLHIVVTLAAHNKTSKTSIDICTRSAEILSSFSLVIKLKDQQNSWV